MNTHLLDSANLFWSSSSFLTSTTRSTKVLTNPKNPSSPLLLIKAAKKRSQNSAQGIQRQPKKDLSRILRTEAAIKAIERKANSTKYNRLWPKAVWEALDDAIREHRWESALKSKLKPLREKQTQPSTIGCGPKRSWRLLTMQYESTAGSPLSRIFNLLRKQHWYEPRCQTYTKLLVLLGKCRQPKQASLLFEILWSDGLQPTLDVYTALVGAYGLSGVLVEAFHTVDHMKSVSDCKPDIYTYSILINCCTKLHRFDLIEHILAEMSNLRIECTTVTYNTIIDGYVALAFQTFSHLIHLLGLWELRED
ncbi:unnamed protein product [Camellia sinensis]